MDAAGKRVHVLLCPHGRLFPLIAPVDRKATEADRPNGVPIDRGSKKGLDTVCFERRLAPVFLFPFCVCVIIEEPEKTISQQSSAMLQCANGHAPFCACKGSLLLLSDTGHPPARWLVALVSCKSCTLQIVLTVGGFPPSNPRTPLPLEEALIIRFSSAVSGGFVRCKARTWYVA